MDSVFHSALFWAQIFGLVAMSINILSWQIKNPRWIIFSYCPASALWAIQYLLLGAPLGAIMNICGSCKDGALAFIKDKYVPFLIGAFLTVTWCVGLYFFKNWFDVLPLIAGTIINLALLQRDNRPLVSRAGVIATSCWIIYNYIVGSYMGFICGCLVIISSTVGMARFEKWDIGKCYKSFLPSLARSLFIFPNFRTYP